MNILHKNFGVVWSWSEIAKQLFKELQEHHFTTDYSNVNTDLEKYDVIFLQQITLLKTIHKSYYNKTIVRLGGNKTFNDEGRNMEELKEQMRQCFAVIATNKFLYDIAITANPNTFLIPNGLNLDDWSVIKKIPKTFTVGFVGNISHPSYRDYKGYDFVEQACKELNIPLKTALYGNGQIPHNQMREKFYSEISCLVHPTKGEGNSNVIMESLSVGIPVITTKEAGFHGEMLEDNENVLFCERTVESVKKCIEKLRNDKELYHRLKMNGRKFAEEYHDIKKIAKQYDFLFQACYEENKNKGIQKEQGRNKMIVKVIKEIYENGLRIVGSVFETTEERARQLKGYVIPLEQQEEQQVKAVVEPHKDKMIKESDVKKEEDNNLVCDVCGFKAKSKIGLIAHTRKHKDKK